MQPVDAVVAEDDELDLRSYWAVFRRRWKAILLVLVIVTGAAIGLSLSREPQYRAASELLIRQRTTADLFASDAVTATADVERQLNNEVQILESARVKDAVRERYDGPLSVSAVDASVGSAEADVIQLSAVSTDPEAAAELVNIYASTYIDVRREERVEDVLAAGSEIQERIDDLGAQADELRAPLADLDAEIAANPDDVSLVEQRAQLEAELAADLTPIESQQAFYDQQLEDLQLTAGLAQSGGAQVLTPATPPSSQQSPNPLRDGVIAALVGLMLGVGLAFVLDNLDERIRGTADLDRAAHGLPVMGLIPEVEGRAARAPDFVSARDDTRSPAAESYRTLRTSVKFSALDRPIKVLQVTSSITAEGKTTTVANLATAFSQGGDRVAVICCDLRRPKIHERFGLQSVPGFTDVLVGDSSLSDALRRYSSNLMVLPAGSPPPNPSELLSTGRAAAVIGALREEFDIVLIDSTPVLPVTDALVVSRLADATLVVANARSTKRKALSRTISLLNQVNAPLLGVVLNNVSTDQGYGYGYGYGYGSMYYAEAEPEPKRRRRNRDKDVEPAESAPV